jgi:hypothetical protein
LAGGHDDALLDARRAGAHVPLIAAGHRPRRRTTVTFV